MAVERGIPREQLRTEPPDKSAMIVWSRWIWELLLSGFFACEGQRIETLDEIIPLWRNGGQFAHDGLSQAPRKGPQAKKPAPVSKWPRVEDNIGKLTRGVTTCIAIYDCLSCL